MVAVAGASQSSSPAKPGRRRPFLTIIITAAVIIMWYILMPKLTKLENSFPGSSHQGMMDETLWWISNLRDTPLRLQAGASSTSFQFPSSIKRVWVDVGVHKQSDFIVDLEKNSDLFVIGLEPGPTWQECPHERCVVLWAAATPDYRIVDLNMQGGGGLCDSLFPPNTNTTSRLWRGCVTQLDTADKKPMKMQVPGIPLHALVSRIPDSVVVEYVKIDAQGFDLEVMKGALPASNKLQVVSLEAMDVTDRGKVLYHGQPTLDNVKEFLAGRGWSFVKAVSNKGVAGEVNAFFVSKEEHRSKVDRLAEILMGNKEGEGQK